MAARTSIAAAAVVLGGVSAALLYRKYKGAQCAAAASECCGCSKTEEAPLPDVETRDGFVQFYETLRDDMCAELGPKYEMPEDAVQWIKKMIDYNVPGGKLNRGITVVHALKSIVGRKLTTDEARKAAVCGWAIEWLQACFLVADDVMDGSLTRRGQPCWYKNADVEMIAINDAFILRSGVSMLLKKYFEHEAYYVQLCEIFRETILQTELGQLLDLTSEPHGGVVDLSRFTVERQKKIVKYKTAFYSFYLPIAAAMIIGGKGNAAALAEAQDILIDMGEYFQIQDDYLDCYGSPEVIGKIGTDIQDNKCGWLVVKALAMANEQQRAIIQDNYGKWDDACVARIKALYAELNLVKVFEDYEAEVHASLVKRIAAVKHVDPAVYNGLLAKIFKRAK